MKFRSKIILKVGQIYEVNRALSGRLFYKISDISPREYIGKRTILAEQINNNFVVIRDCIEEYAYVFEDRHGARLVKDV